MVAQKKKHLISMSHCFSHLFSTFSLLPHWEVRMVKRLWIWPALLLLPYLSHFCQRFFTFFYFFVFFDSFFTLHYLSWDWGPPSSNYREVH
jgi:hypothetical protein